MVKLVRLESDAVLTESQFTNNLSIPLHLGENAKVSLKTLSMQFDKPLFSINDSNNLLSFDLNGLTGASPTPVLLSNGFYLPNDLMGHITAKMNNAIDSVHTGSTADVNFEWRAMRTTDTNSLEPYTHIEFARDDPIILNNTNTQLDVITYSTTNSIFYKAPNNNDGTYNSDVFSSHFLCRGGWLLKMQIKPQAPGQVPNVKDSKWMFYLEREKETADITTKQFIIDTMICGIMSNTSGNYAYKKGGIMVDTSIPVLIDDIVTIGKHLGQFWYYISRSNTAVLDVAGDDINTSAPYTGSSKLYLGLKVGDDTGSIAFANMITTKSPFSIVTSGVYTENLNTTSDVIRNTNLTTKASLVELYIPSSGLRNILGFDKSKYSKNVVNGAFLAEHTLTLGYFNNDLVVECLEFNVNSYDHTYKQLRNIIMVITSGDVQKSLTTNGSDTYELTFTDQFPTYLSLGNPKTSLQIPSITVRVTSGGSTLPMNGKISLLLLLKDDTDT